MHKHMSSCNSRYGKFSLFIWCFEKLVNLLYIGLKVFWICMFRYLGGWYWLCDKQFWSYLHYNSNCIGTLAFTHINLNSINSPVHNVCKCVYLGIFDRSSRRAFLRSGTDVGQKGLFSISSQRYSIGLRSGQSYSSATNSLINVFMDLVY